MDNAIKIAVGLGGGLASFLFGGWTALLQTLVLFIVLDYIFAINENGQVGFVHNGVIYRSFSP